MFQWVVTKSKLGPVVGKVFSLKSGLVENIKQVCMYTAGRNQLNIFNLLYTRCNYSQSYIQDVKVNF